MPGSFTQFSLGNHTTGANPAVNNNISPISFETLSPERIKDVRLQMVSQLQTTLEVDQILTIFHRHLKQHLTISGIQYTNGNHMIDAVTGYTAKHRASYQLSLQNQDYGANADVFANFRKSAQRHLPELPEHEAMFKILMILQDKHLVALSQTGLKGNEVAERLRDVAVYALIGAGMLADWEATK